MQLQVKAQEEILIPENIQVTESRSKKTDDNLEDEKRNATPPTLKNRNIIDAPSRCPDGYRADPTGKCRRIWH